MKIWNTGKEKNWNYVSFKQTAHFTLLSVAVKRRGLSQNQNPNGQSHDLYFNEPWVKKWVGDWKRGSFAEMQVRGVVAQTTIEANDMLLELASRNRKYDSMIFWGKEETGCVIGKRLI